MNTRMSNIEMLNHEMNFAQTGGLSQVFVMEAIRSYAETILASETPWPEDHIIGEDAWKLTAQNWVDRLKAHYDGAGA